MALIKYALCDIAVPLNTITEAKNKNDFIRTAAGKLFLEPNSEQSKIVESEIKKHPTALFFRSKAIKADEPNSNGDYFSESELIRAHKTFEGVPFFTNHNNQNVENARGKIIFAEWVPEEKSIYTISFVDREAFPHICRSIEEEYITGVSMGCSVEYSVCNICSNRAEKTEDYCTHIKERKGRTFSGRARDVKTGEVKEFKNHQVFEYNYGIKFIELSAVVDPACPSCRIESLMENDDILKKVANLENHLHMIKTAAIIKEAGKEEVDQLNNVLKTLEDIAVQLIKNRQQIEVEFASDLVNILSELQVFVDELIGAGYGNVQSQIPGNAEAPPPPPQGNSGSLSPQITETASPSPSPIPPPPANTVGTVSGAPNAPLAQKPKLPITAPIKPKSSDKGDRMMRAASVISNLESLINKITTGEEDMSKRRTLDNKLGSQEQVTKILSSSWKEKQQLLEYIDKVPSIQDNENKLSVKKRDDTFIIVAENKNNNYQQVWTYEDLNGAEKDLIKGSPKDAALYFLETFANNLKPNIKEGETVMSNMKEAGAKSVNKTPEVVTEAQLEGAKGLYHPRTGDEANVITEKQLVRNDEEKQVITEAQLEAKTNKLNPRTDTQAEVITEAQLEDKAGVSPRKDSAPTVITQSQLKDNRTGTDTEVITERQLDSVDAPWERAANRDAKLFKSAGEHMSKVIDVLADTVISTGCTAEEACQVGSSLIDSTKNRVEFNKAILASVSNEGIDYSKRLAYWSKKNIKVASAGTEEIAKSIVSGMQKVASDTTINPEVVIDALDVVSEGIDGEIAISKKIDEKLALAAKEVAKVSKKDELRSALKASVEAKKEIASEKKVTREAERAILTKAISASEKSPDHMIETSFQELGAKKTDSNFRAAIKPFARGALASQNMKLASVTNVTISGDTIAIAVQTDEGEQSVEVPIGEEATPTEPLPEGDLTGEGLENTVGSTLAASPAPAPAPAPAGLPTGMASAKTMTKVAQTPSGAGVPGTPGGVTAPGAPEQGLPGAAPQGDPVQALTQDEPQEIPDEIPTAGEQQPPWAICPECGSSDTDVTMEEGGKNHCNACGAEYEALIEKEIKFKVTKPTKSVGKDDVAGAPEAPEVPALPVAAQAKLTKDVMTRIASNQAKHGHVCPACGMKQCKASVEGNGHIEYKCPACNTDITKELIANVNKPDEGYLRVSWDLVPKIETCASCKESVKKFASLQKIQKMMKSASESKFPRANCMELVAKKWGGNAVALTGPCKGKPLADCVCGTLEKLGLTKVRHLEKLASVLTQKDPMVECVEDQMKQKGFEKKEAETICNCLKKKFASKEDDNIFIQAFMGDIDSGVEKNLNAQDLDTINDLVGTSVEAPVEEAPVEDMEISDAIPTEVASETVSVELPKEVAQELAGAVNEAVEAVEVEIAPVEEEVSVKEELPAAEPTVTEKSTDTAVSDAKSDSASSDIKSDIKSDTEENEMSIAQMQVHKILRVGEAVVKVAATPKKVEHIEVNVEAKVPRNDQKLGEEGKADSLINKPNKGPEVPRKDAYMGKEKEADSLINKELKLPDVAVDSSYMGKNEQANQKGMPAINNEIKGTVIASEDKAIKEAKKMEVIDTVEKEVGAKVPRNESKLGEEAKADSLINEKNKGPEVPRKDAYMGEEKGADSLINKKLDGPDVPIDSAYMGDEKSVQKDMPAINDKILKNVAANKDVQLERIAMARRMKAVEVTAKLLATKRIPEGAYENVIEALSKFEIDKIAIVAESMYPMRKQASEVVDKNVYSGPVPVMESKEIVSSSPANELSKKLASSFSKSYRGSANWE